MAGERSLGGVLAGAGGGTGAGVPGLLALLLAMEAGVSVPVPSDLVMLASPRTSPRASASPRQAGFTRSWVGSPGGGA